MIIVWNSHAVDNIFAPESASWSTPFSVSWAFVHGSDVRMIVLNGSPVLLKDSSTCPPAASIIKCSAFIGGALLSATPLQM